jgi:hypothetical protein
MDFGMQQQQPSWLQNTYGINQQDYMNDPYSNGFAPTQNNSFVPVQNNSTFQNPFGNMDMQSMMGYGKGAMDLFGAYNQYQNQKKTIDMAKKQFGFEQGVYNDNRLARNSFINTTRNAFGSPNQLS